MRCEAPCFASASLQQATAESVYAFWSCRDELAASMCCPQHLSERTLRRASCKDWSASWSKPTTSPIGHGRARSWRQTGRIGRSRSTVVAAVWHSRSVSIAVPGRYVRSWSISVAVPGFYVRAWSIAVAVAGLDVGDWSVVITITGLYVRGCSISIAIAGTYVRSCSIGRRGRRHVNRPGSSTNVDAAGRHINGLRRSTRNVHR
jgi:hypothetical protein